MRDYVWMFYRDTVGVLEEFPFATSTRHHIEDLLLL